MEWLEEFETEISLKVGGPHSEQIYPAAMVIDLAVQALRKIVIENPGAVLGWIKGE